MAKVIIELELDEASYRAKYGPGTEWWKKYCTERDLETGEIQSRPASEYKPMEGERLEAALVDILSEGLYDWKKHGWLKLKIDGKEIKLD